MNFDYYENLIKNDFSSEFGKFAEMLINYNKICNITSVSDEKGIFYKHFLDSAVGESLFSRGASVVEIGSGGGFPSLPLKFLRDDLSFTLIESTGKKCTFLKSVVDNFGLKSVKVENIRAEDGARDKNMREKFDFACARAVARLNTLCEYCLPFVAVGGKFIAYKGDSGDEVKEAEKAIKTLGGEVENIIEYELPYGYGKRSLIVIKKIKNTPSAYPRGLGKERKNPL